MVTALLWPFAFQWPAALNFLRIYIKQSKVYPNEGQPYCSILEPSSTGFDRFLVASPPIGQRFIISHSKWLFHSVGRWSAPVTGRICFSFCTTSLPHKFTLYLFELKSVAFHWLLPRGDISLAAELWGINNTCLSLKLTCFKRHFTSLQRCTHMQRLSHWMRSRTEVYNERVTREQL